MEINRVSAIYPVLRVKSFNKENKTDSKSKNDKRGKDFEQTLMSKKQEGAVIDARA